LPQIDWLALIPFVFITNFTPGPNVIPAMSLGVLYGFRKAMRFCAGILTGYIFLMLASAFVASALFAAFPAFENGLRVIGAIYIAYLAFTTLRKSFQIEINNQPMYGFWQGLLMQFVNIKGMLFGLTLFSTFLAPLQASITWQVMGAAGIAFSAFSAAVTTRYLGRLSGAILPVKHCGAG